MVVHSLSDFNFIEGEVLLFDKPLYWTSFDLVSKVRYTISKNLGKKKIKVGHAGTLDPLATGLIIICTGKKTKEIELYQATEKEYIAELFIGATTPSFDRETEINQQFETNHISEALIRKTLEKFVGEIQQLPPSYSAKKIDGQRAYLKAHKGIEVAMKPSTVNIYENEFLSFSNQILKIKIRCSKGTYIRSLANDIGKAMHTGAYLYNLQRTKVGNFNIEQAMKIEDFVLDSIAVTA
ncbi:MAG: tRNA pseudouridine(55) synthase TruB [Bacteroidales bacterium]